MGSEFIGELIGTFILVLLGNGIVAGNLLDETKSNNAGWLTITIGWGIAVAIGAFASGYMSPAHLNPAVTIAFAVAGDLPWGAVLPYIGAQMLGAFLGAIVVWIQYKDHYDVTKDQDSILATFATIPAIYNPVSNMVSEVIGTFVLMFGLLSFSNYGTFPWAGYLVVGVLIVGIGLSLGGTTGYAINPARDLGPRIAHAFLPIANKGDSDWKYAYIPVVGPILGAVLAAVIYGLI
ncbi:MAG TPA: MIP/aquaporin family protein [Atopostipes sp.]|nr:MIP/aquaporin family protein [Atopostipes sp.]